MLESEPAEPFELIGLVEAAGQGRFRKDERALSAAKAEACRIGGDAIVLLYRRSAEDRIGGSSRGSGTLPAPELRAAVIRYRR